MNNTIIEIVYFFDYVLENKYDYSLLNNEPSINSKYSSLNVYLGMDEDTFYNNYPSKHKTPSEEMYWVDVNESIDGIDYIKVLIVEGKVEVILFRGENIKTTNVSDLESVNDEMIGFLSNFNQTGDTFYKNKPGKLIKRIGYKLRVGNAAYFTILKNKNQTSYINYYGATPSERPFFKMAIYNNDYEEYATGKKKPKGKFDEVFKLLDTMDSIMSPMMNNSNNVDIDKIINNNTL